MSVGSQEVGNSREMNREDAFTKCPVGIEREGKKFERDFALVVIRA
jgi:hypothetical protein